MTSCCAMLYHQEAGNLFVYLLSKNGNNGLYIEALF